MNSRTVGLRVAGTIFGLMSLAQLLRWIIRLEIRLAGHFVPMRLSLVAFLVLAGLSAWLWSLSGRADK